VNQSKKIYNGHTEVFLRPDNIVQLNAANHVFSIEDIKTNTRSIGELTNKQKTLVLVVAAEFSDMEKEARHFTSTAEAMKYSIAEAYVINSLAQRLLANFASTFLGFSVPVKFFNEIEPAVEWLKTFNNKVD